MSQNIIAVGTRVKWTSQSQGKSKEKEGVVVEVLRAGEQPSKEWRDIWRRGPGEGRTTESYVVQVGKANYWPIVGKLQIVDKSRAA